MTTADLFADLLARNIEFLNMTVADFSDADMLARIAPAANHTAWQIGHLIVAETGMINGVKPGASPELPAGFAAKFTKETCSSNDPKAFPKKDELLAQFAKTRGATVKWAKGLTPREIDQPIEGDMKKFVPTVGHLAAMIPSHVSMHMGQMQALRRKLGKPVLF